MHIGILFYIAQIGLSRVLEIQNMTFRDRLMGFSPTRVEDDPYNGISEDDKGDKASEDDIYCPILKVTNEEKRRLPKP